MKMRLVAIVTLAISFAVPAFAQEQNTVDPEVRQQIEGVNKKLEEAYNKYDATAFAAVFTLDALDWLGWEGTAISGQEAIIKRFEAEFASYPPKQSFKLVQVYAIGRDICAISEFIHYHLSGKGHSVLIVVREAEEWKIRVAYSN
jgi:uncharacterized protein (TIGR02246 family)